MECTMIYGRSSHIQFSHHRKESMFQTIQEGLEVYKEAVREYVKHIKDLKQQGYELDTLGTSHTLTLQALNARLDGMTEALGLSEEERTEIEASCGLDELEL